MAFKILDATSFYAGVPFASQEKGFTTPLVFDEIKHIKKSHDAVQALIDLGRLDIVEPEERFTVMVRDKAGKTGDLADLSRGDVSVLALCMQLKGELVTDDYTVSNVAKHLGLNVIPIMTKGISRVLESAYYCPACKKVLEKTSECPVCGSKPVKRSSKRKPPFGPGHNT